MSKLDENKKKRKTNWLVYTIMLSIAFFWLWSFWWFQVIFYLALLGMIGLLVLAYRRGARSFKDYSDFFKKVLMIGR